jgi:hypothetical protein
MFMNRGEKNIFGSLSNLPLDRILVEVPIDSPEYQAFLEANRLREQSREEFGGPDPKAEEGYREAVGKLSEFARVLYARKRAS